MAHVATIVNNQFRISGHHIAGHHILGSHSNLVPINVAPRRSGTGTLRPSLATPPRFQGLRLRLRTPTAIYTPKPSPCMGTYSEVCSAHTSPSKHVCPPRTHHALHADDRASSSGSSTGVLDKARLEQLKKLYPRMAGDYYY